MTQHDEAVGGYNLGGSQAAQSMFGRRSATDDAAFLLPFLKPGMSIVDCGCGRGNITIGLAQVVAPGEVFGFDIQDSAIAIAKESAASQNVTNAHFEAADVYAPPLTDESFDVAFFSGVLAHLEDPARALDVAFRLLKPGGLVAAVEPQKGADWFAGPYAEHMRKLMEGAVRGWKGDPMLGLRLPALLGEARFIRVEAAPGYAPALSSAKAQRENLDRFIQDPEMMERIVQTGLAAREDLPRVIEEMKAWGDSEASVAAFAECRAVGWKPGP
jgi:SAM-dependent methyltransferase